MKPWTILFTAAGLLGAAAWAELQRAAEHARTRPAPACAVWRDDAHEIFRALAYDEERQLLTVEFRMGYAYRYQAVPRDCYLAFRAAGAKGTFYNERIRGRYAMERAPDRCVTRPGPAPEPGPRAFRSEAAAP